MADHDWSSVSGRREQNSNRDGELREERLRAEAPHRPHRNRDLAWLDSTRPAPKNTTVRTFRSESSLFGNQFGTHSPFSRPLWEFARPSSLPKFGPQDKVSSKRLRLLPKLFH